MGSALTITDFVAIALAIWLLKKIASHKAAARLPPGPRRLPVIGNLLDIPAEYPWKAFREWGQRWGKFDAFVSSTGGSLIIPYRRHRIARHAWKAYDNH